MDADDGFEGAAELTGYFLEPIIRAFYRGVDAHEEGKKSWSRHLDRSV